MTYFHAAAVLSPVPLLSGGNVPSSMLSGAPTLKPQQIYASAYGFPQPSGDKVGEGAPAGLMATPGGVNLVDAGNLGSGASLLQKPPMLGDPNSNIVPGTGLDGVPTLTAPMVSHLYPSDPANFGTGQMLLSSLNQNRPPGDTSGLQQPTGMLLSGANSKIGGVGVGSMPALGMVGTRPLVPGAGVPAYPQGQQQQQQSASQASISTKQPKPWHNAANDASTRLDITNRIISLLQARKSTSVGDWQSKLPQMAKKLEDALYYQGNSFAEYSDPQTLKTRLQHLASSMGHSKPSTSAGAPAPQSGAPQLNRAPVPGQAVTAGPAPGGSSAPAPSGTQSTKNFISMSQINSFIGTQQQSGTSEGGAADPFGEHSGEGSKAADGSGSGQSQDPNSEEMRKQMVLKQQQQRLLLLRHASKCQHETRCPVTPHCANMKQLWRHIMGCRDQDCKTAHCVSSRYVLSHYSKCKDPACPVCGPVREAIIRNHEKSKQIVDITRKQMGADGAQSDAARPQAGAKEQTTKGKKQSGLSIRLPGNAAAAAAEASKHTEIVAAPPAPSQPRVINMATLDCVSCPIYSLSDQDIMRHINGLQEGLRMKSSDVKEKMLPIIEHFISHTNGYIFARPVDPISLNIPDYFEIVKNPMDLGTIRKRLENGVYRDWEDVAQDARLTFDNAMLYNPKSSEVHAVAKQFKRDFEVRYKAMLSKYELEIEQGKRAEGACHLCGDANLKFEPPVYYCNGRRCSCQRIRRGSNYYMGGNNAYHWCAPCYNELKENIPIELPDMKLYKRDLQKKKHDQEFPEPWVQCDKCQSWVHMICALFNNRRNISDVMAFVCPTCVLKERKLNVELKPIVSEKKMHASDLPHCKLSQFIETRVMERLELAYAERARITDTPIDQVERCPNLSIRQVSSVDKVHRTREGMLARYAFKNYPAEFPVRSKCIVLFQNVDGQDLVLFGMYVYEYGHKCPQPNQRRVYISYLDSVHYFRPRHYRTLVYHEILVSYLEYVKMRGFHTAHIWACPPLKGDDYILYCHPQDQKTPKDDRLRQWYVQMLDICKKRGIVLESSTDIFTEYLANTSNDASVLPYFEGDYWVGEAENIIKGLGKKGLEGLSAGDEEEVESEGESKASKSKSKSKAAASKKRDRSTRSGGTTRTGRDVVMTKLAAIIEPMKEAFFVAKMHPDDYAKACMELRQQELNVESGDVESSKKRMRTEGGMERSVSRTELASAEGSNTADVAGESAVKTEGSDAAVVKAEKQGGADADSTPTAAAATDAPAPAAQGDAAASSDAVKSEATEGVSAEAKASAPAPPKTTEMVAAELGLKSEVFNGIRVIDTEDVDDTMECEHFETRQAFLNICQGNHYQFDQLRRAKHTSLMVLYHLHNPDEPKFVAQCGVCNESILSGYRYHCEPCDVDYCQRCYQYNGPKIHPLHQLRAVAVGGQPTQLTSEQMRERQRTIQIHLAVLSHSALCTVADCKTKNCPKMKVRAVFAYYDCFPLV